MPLGQRAELGDTIVVESHPRGRDGEEVTLVDIGVWHNPQVVPVGVEAHDTHQADAQQSSSREPNAEQAPPQHQRTDRISE